MGQHTTVSGTAFWVDDKDDEYVAKFRWYSHKAGTERPGSAPYVVRADKRMIYLHRELLAAPKDLQVDHIDGDRTNNRRTNLRLCSHSENGRNRQKNANNTSGFKGVTWRKDARRWRAQIRSGGRYKHLGHYDTPEAAHRAYCVAAAELHGEFARTSDFQPEIAAR